MFGRLVAVFLGLLVLLGSVGAVAPRPAAAWDKDSHYYLIYYLAIAVCFEPSEAYLIAMGDWSADTYPGTSPLPTFHDLKSRDWTRFVRAGLNYHALGDWDDVQKRYAELRGQAFDALRNLGGSFEAALIKLGVYLHYRQDMLSHEGYKPPLGHALATVLNEDPDSMATNPAKTRAMINAVVQDLTEACLALNRQPKDPRGGAFDKMVSDLIEGSDPVWKRQRTRVAIILLTYPANIPVSYYEIYKLFKADTAGYREVLKHNSKRVGQELEKLVGTNQFPPPQTIDLELLTGRTSRIVYRGVADPVDVAMLLDDTFLAVVNDSLVFRGTVTIYNAGDTPTPHNASGIVALLGEDGDFIAALELPGYMLDPGVRALYNVSMTVPLSILPEGYVMLYGVADGSWEDFYFYNNVFQIAFNASGLKRLSASATGVGNASAATLTATETSTVTSTVTETTTVTLTPTGTTTITLTTFTRTSSRTVMLPGTGVGVDLLTLLLGLVAVLLAALLLRGLLAR